ncbi:hypothetical protein ACM26W_14130 [Halomonas sp. HK25]|uniref:hypothetical protein n=1 Tax=Halomonas sp. HK25 TaxID=3394321 RepID=UPI0039FC1BE1
MVPLEHQALALEIGFLGLKRRQVMAAASHTPRAEKKGDYPAVLSPVIEKPGYKQMGECHTESSKAQTGRALDRAAALLMAGPSTSWAVGDSWAPGY